MLNTHTHTHISEVSIYSKTKISAYLITEDNYVGVENILKDKQGKMGSKYVPNDGKFIKYELGDIVIGNIRPYLRKIWYSNNEGGASGDVLVIHVKDTLRTFINSRYLYHILASEKFFEYNIKYSKGAKMPRGDKKKIMEYEFPIPSLAVQNHIVDMLDKFHDLTSDLREGLPKEIALRQKQYEYYREKLLDFKK